MFVRECDVFLPWKSHVVSVKNVFYGIIEDGHSFFVIWRLSLWGTLIEVHSFNCPEELEKIFIWIVYSSLDKIENCYAFSVWFSDPLLCVPLRNGPCQCPAKQSVGSVWITIWSRCAVVNCLGTVAVNASAPKSFPIWFSRFIGYLMFWRWVWSRKSNSTFQFGRLLSEIPLLLLRTQWYWSQDNCCTKLLCRLWHLLF